MNQAFVAALDAAAVSHSDEFYGNGTHAWPYWERDLGHFLPQMAAAFQSAPVGAPQIPFSYRSAQQSFSVWDWTFTAQRPVVEFTYLAGVSAAGLRATGSGRLGVVSAPAYVPGMSYVVSQGNRRHRVAAGSDGRIAFI